MKKVTLFIFLVWAVVYSNPTLINLPADSWHRASGTHLMSVTPGSQYLQSNGIYLVTGPYAIIDSWGGGAYDSKRHKMIVWGGGHNDYGGNELYTFDLTSLSWQRYTEPSFPPFDRDPLNDGKPVSRHTYDGLQFITHADRFFGFGGSMATGGGGTSLTWIFDMDGKTWTNRQPAGTRPGAGHLYNLSSAYDPVTKKVFMRDPYAVYAYSYESNAWSKLKDWSHGWSQQRGVLDFKRRLFFIVGSGEFQVYNIDTNADVTSQWTTTGGSAVISAPSPGVDYDVNADQLVAWIGGGVYALDMGSKAWSRKSGSGAPAAQSQYGTFGRWRYVPEYNVFMIVNSVNDDVYFYKHSAGGATGVEGGRKITGVIPNSIAASPNPFKAFTALSFPVSLRARARLTLHDAAGRQVADLTEKAKGKTMMLDARAYPAGIYIARLHTGGSVYQHALVIVR